VTTRWQTSRHGFQKRHWSPSEPKTSRKGQRHHRKAQHRLALKNRVEESIPRSRASACSFGLSGPSPTIQSCRSGTEPLGESERPQQGFLILHWRQRLTCSNVKPIFGAGVAPLVLTRFPPLYMRTILLREANGAASRLRRASSHTAITQSQNRHARANLSFATKRIRRAQPGRVWSL